MKLSLYEQETIILYNQAEAAAEVYTHDPRLLEKLRRLAEKYPDQIVKRTGRPFSSLNAAYRSGSRTAPSAAKQPVNGPKLWALYHHKRKILIKGPFLIDALSECAIM